MKSVKNVLLAAFVAVVSLCLASCSSSDGKTQLESYQKVNTKIFKEQIDASAKNGIPQIIDYRPAEEFAAGHLENAVSIPVSDKNAEDKIKSELSRFDRNRNIYVYGSVKTNNTLGFYLAGIVSKEGWGVSYTYNLLEGYEGWVEAGYPVTK